MKAGDVITEKNMRSIRPGYGLPPKYYDVVMGKKVNRDVKRGTGLNWEMLG
jgi:sialic acid synthase SpsE